jgi:hypothetical protein
MSEKKSVIQAFGGWGVVILMVLGLAAVLAYERWQRQGSGEALQEIASELGLNVTAAGNKRFQMRGRIDDIGVAVDTELVFSSGTQQLNYYTSFKLYAPDGPSGRIVGVSLRQQAIDGWTGEQRMLTGDHAFDEEVFVSGDPATMLAFLNAEARAAVLPAAKAGWSLERTTWSALEAGRMTDPDEIRSLLALGLNAARATRLDGDIDTSLQVQAERDPVAGVRAAAAAAQGTSMPAASASAFVSQAEALAALEPMGSESAFAAALFLAEQGDDRQAVRMALVGMLVDTQRQARAIEALANVGIRLDIAVLRVVKGEHEAAAKAAIASIEARLP